MGPGNSGAYGFRLVSPAHAEALPNLGFVPEDAPSVVLNWHLAALLADRRLIQEDVVSMGVRGRSSMEIHRDPPSILLGLIDTPTSHARVHPLLTTPISVLARWRGDLTLHAGSFFANGRAWGLIGIREAGKSTMLASLGDRGYRLLADDLLVLDGRMVRSGPACVDLRPDVAERFPNASFIGEIAERPRYRLSTSPGPTTAELAGFFLLDWREDREVHVELVQVAEALRILYDHEYMGLVGPADSDKILDLLEVPMWRVSRRRDWDVTDGTIDRIRDVVAENS